MWTQAGPCVPTQCKCHHKVETVAMPTSGQGSEVSAVAAWHMGIPVWHHLHLQMSLLDR